MTLQRFVAFATWAFAIVCSSIFLVVSLLAIFDTGLLTIVRVVFAVVFVPLALATMFGVLSKPPKGTDV